MQVSEAYVRSQVSEEIKSLASRSNLVMSTALLVARSSMQQALRSGLRVNLGC